MDKILRPVQFSADPTSSSAAKDFKHWLRTFENFLNSIENHAPDKLNALINLVSPDVYEFIEDIATYEDALNKLKEIYQQTENEVFAKHILATRSQKAGENVDMYIQSLRRLAKDCNFKEVTAETHRDEAIRGVFYAGLASNVIRQRLSRCHQNDSFC